MLNFNWLAGVPLVWAKALIICCFIIPAAFALALKKDYIYAGAEDRAWWRNLKIWIVLITVTQIAIYLYF